MYEVNYTYKGCTTWRTETTVSNKYYAIRKAKWLLEYTDVSEVMVTEVNGIMHTTIFHKGANDEV